MTQITYQWTWGNLLSKSFQDEDQAGYLEISPDAGKPFRREVFTDIDDIVRGSILLDLGNYNLFKNWYRNQLKQGTIPFTFYDCRVEEDRIARFIDKPLYRQLSNKWSIDVKLSLEQIKKEIDYYLLTQGGQYILTENDEKIIATKEIIV